jgi:ABC-type transport system involved in multi-copper enzyme maturation permease subunit
MLSLFRAEWHKIAGNRITVAAFVGIFPISAFMLLIFAGIAVLTSPSFRQNVVNAPPNWMDQLLFPWIIINSEIGRGIMAAFAADVFGGEYQRMMWKNLLQRRGRSAIILNKFFTMAVFVVAAFLLMCVIIGVGVGILTALAGAAYPPALSDLAPGELERFLRQFGAQASVAFAAALIAAAYAALGGIFTRSILGAVAVGVLLTLAEQGIAVMLFILNQIAENPDLLQLYLFTPGYNLANLSTWAGFGGGYLPPYMTPYGFTPFSVEASTLLVIAWLVGLISACVWLFRRQDITT